MMTTAIPFDGRKHDDGTTASGTAGSDGSCCFSVSVDGNRQPEPGRDGMRSSSIVDSSNFSRSSSMASTEFSVGSSAGSHHFGSEHPRQASISSRPSSSRHRGSNEIFEHQPALATETNRMRTVRKLAEFSQNSLDFSRITMVGREKEKRVLDRLFQQILRKPTSAVSVSASSSSSSDEERSASPNDDESSTSDVSNQGSPGIDNNQNAIGHHANAQTTTIRSLVSISGYSGTGKSALANTLRPKCKVNGVFFVSGKFDLKKMDEPYSGFRTAMTDLCSQICALPRSNSAGGKVTHRATERQGKDTRTFDVIKHRITDDLNIDELQSLNKLIPNLVDVVGSEALSYTKKSNNNDNDGDESTVVSASQRAQATQGFKEQSIRLKFAFRRFIKIICSCCPLVWVSDDVQWADKESLNMIESWMLDTTISSLMVIVCFRSNLVNMDGINNGNTSNDNDLSRKRTSDFGSVSSSSATDLVGPLLASIRKKKRERSIRYVNLEVNNLSLDNLHTMLKQLLGIYNDDDDSSNRGNASTNSYGLAEIVFKKTDGNVFFVQQFIRMLAKDTLLSYDIASMKWLWDNDQIKQETPATINVAELMELKLQQIDTAQYLLPLAACLGSTFSWLLLRTTLAGFVADDGASEDGHRALYESLFGGPPPATEKEWLDILKVYEEEGLIEAHTSGGTTNKINRSGDHDTSGVSASQSVLSESAGPAPAASASVTSEYSFIHDKVQEAALGMIPTKMHLLELQHRVGIILMDRLSPDDSESSVFVLANLLNSRLDMVPQYPSSASPSLPSTTPIEDAGILRTRRFRVAKLNFDAGIKAASHAAFRAAYSYLQTAIDMMPPDHWQSHHDMSIELFTSAAECAYVSNNFERMEKYGQMVIERDDCSLIDKMRAYHVLMDGELASIQRNKASDMMKLGSELMTKLGYRYPKNNTMRLVMTIWRIMKLKISAKKWTIGHLDSMQPSEDPMNELTMNTLDRYLTGAFMADQSLYALIAVDLINHALTKGTTTFTSFSIATLAMMLGPILGDMKAGKLYANYAMHLCETNSDKSASVRTTLVAYGFVLSNFIPYEGCKQPFLDAHLDGMSIGDTQNAMWVLLYYLDLCFFTAKPLGDLEVDLSTYTNQCEDFNQTRLREYLASRWQMVLNLRGWSDQQTLLVGEIFDEITVMQRLVQTKDEGQIIDLLDIKLFTSAYFGDYDDAVKTAFETYDNVDEGKKYYISTMSFLFLSSLAATIVFHQHDHLSWSKRHQVKRLARRSRQALRAMVNKGNPNAIHGLAILNAEKAAWKAHKGKHQITAFQAAVKLYQDAIRAAARGGFSQNQALANERLAEHMVLEDDTEGAGYHFDESIRLYAEWGADKKVSLLRERRKIVCDTGK